MFSIGAVIPTKNSAALLPEQLDIMQGWMDLIEQVVVVDSFSTDGTVDLIQARLRHPKMTVLTHPPGLYQSWNYGLAQLSTHYAYIATSGDSLTRHGLETLFRVGESLRCDVVLSKPDFYDSSGRLLPDIRWPVDDIIACLRLDQPRKLHRLETLIFAISHATAALTGSCASNLFATQALRRYPFPTEFGFAGDGAWGVLHALDVSWGVVPERFSRFIRHPNDLASSGVHSRPATPPWDRVARQMVEAACRSGALSSEEMARLEINELLDALARFMQLKTAWDLRRKARPPWAFSPAAWRIRLARNRARRRLHQLKIRALKAIPSTNS